MPNSTTYNSNLEMEDELLDPFGKTRILVIDDEQRIRDVCYRMLLEEGFTVTLAENGMEGIEKVQNAHYDIILLDLMMPGLSGLEVLSQVRSIDPDTAIIVITGYATVEHSIEAMKKGAFDFLPKPFAPQDLRLIVSKALEYIRTLKDISTEKSRIRTLINHIGDGVLITDHQKKIALANPAFLKIIGYHQHEKQDQNGQQEEVLGKPVDEVIHEEKLIQLIGKALHMPKDTYAEVTDEISFKEKDSTEENAFGFRCVPFRDRLNRTLGTITVMHDITALKKINQLKSDFVATVGHEIRSPMNSVLAQINVILDGLAGDVTPKQREMLTRAADKIKALSNMSSELLDLAKIEAGLINQDRERIDVPAMLEEQVKFYEQRAKEKSITLTMEEPGHLPSILGNRLNIDEIISNLISNAIRYTPEGGQIEVTAVADRVYLCIQVSDTGFGIAKEDLERIFDRFYRVKNEKTRFINGTGLGLAIVKSIVDAHNGKIRVESEPEKGTTFYIYFPIISA